MSGQKWHVTVSDGLRGGNVYGFDPTDPPDDVVERMARAIRETWHATNDFESPLSWDQLIADLQDGYRALARAALRALTRPDAEVQQ